MGSFQLLIHLRKAKTRKTTRVIQKQRRVITRSTINVQDTEGISSQLGSTTKSSKPKGQQRQG